MKLDRNKVSDTGSPDGLISPSYRGTISTGRDTGKNRSSRPFRHYPFWFWARGLEPISAFA